MSGAEQHPSQPEFSAAQRQECMVHTLANMTHVLPQMGRRIEGRYAGVVSPSEPYGGILIADYPAVQQVFDAERNRLLNASDEEREAAAASAGSNSFARDRGAWDDSVISYATDNQLARLLPADQALAAYPSLVSLYAGLESEITTDGEGRPTLAKRQVDSDGSPGFIVVDLDSLHAHNPAFLPEQITAYHQRQALGHLHRTLHYYLGLHEGSITDTLPPFMIELVQLPPEEQAAMQRAIEVYTRRLTGLDVNRYEAKVRQVVESVQHPPHPTGASLAGRASVWANDLFMHVQACPATPPEDREQHRRLQQSAQLVVSLLGQAEWPSSPADYKFWQQPYQLTDHYAQGVTERLNANYAEALQMSAFLEASQQAANYEAMMGALEQHWPEGKQLLEEFGAWLDTGLSDERVYDAFMQGAVKSLRSSLISRQPLTKELINAALKDRLGHTVVVSQPRGEYDSVSVRDFYREVRIYHPLHTLLEASVLIALRQRIAEESGGVASSLPPENALPDIQNILSELQTSYRREAARLSEELQDIIGSQAANQALFAEAGFTAADINWLINVSTDYESDIKGYSTDLNTFRTLFHVLLLERQGILPQATHPTFVSYLRAFFGPHSTIPDRLAGRDVLPAGPG